MMYQFHRDTLQQVKRQVEVRSNPIFSQAGPDSVYPNKVVTTHPLKLHLGTEKQLHCFVLSIAKLTSLPP